ncbi:MAG: hypothetical protein PHI11_01910 [Gallionella sp.]|nr:hypothetical protein [Gallionella sp.]
MAQFIAFDKNAEGLGIGVVTCISAFPEYARPHVERLLVENNLVNVAPEKWFKVQGLLDVLKEISTNYGPNTLFHIGVTVFERFALPPHITDLESALKLIAVAYREHHRNGRIGYVELRSFDVQAKKAVIEYCNPYPCHFERGIVTACARKYKPQDAHFIDVQLDKDKPSRLDGADSSFYVITWF